MWLWVYCKGILTLKRETGIITYCLRVHIAFCDESRILMENE